MVLELVTKPHWSLVGWLNCTQPPDALESLVGGPAAEEEAMAWIIVKRYKQSTVQDLERAQLPTGGYARREEDDASMRKVDEIDRYGITSQRVRLAERGRSVLVRMVLIVEC
ncbi:uncharacterized protein ColSpa_03858 [Colletotrichum spaethianum]|uniref:Uncharacterized protein n=1 Tax=Colletotrichum spaethianum TaxID=700344 RepID=A0AA37LGG2_9PEZI|nr:uncharacterized protein ColSpa_03858 [Colletotrichum spaethianum]GKT43677.1 hypothetical protein ColSpa_03858 [Colletotrichum spaethianum]